MIIATDGSVADIQAKHDGMANPAGGDTLTIPAASTRTWTTQLTITKAITLKGLGSVTVDGNSRATACGTIVKTGQASNGAILNYPNPNLPTGLSRITGIEFQD